MQQRLGKAGFPRAGVADQGQISYVTGGVFGHCPNPPRMVCDVYVVEVNPFILML